MNKITEALKLAENTLEDIIRVYKFETGTPVTTLAAIREALAEQEKQEPVQFTIPLENSDEARVAIEEVLADYQYPSNPMNAARAGWRAARLAAAPVSVPKQEPVAWVPLTDDDRKAAFESLPDALEGFMKKWGWLHFAKEIERRCKEKNK